MAIIEYRITGTGIASESGEQLIGEFAMLKIEAINALREIRGRLDYAERNINTHMLDDTGISSKMQVDGIVLSILHNSKTSMAEAYLALGMDPAEVIAAYDHAIANCDNREITYNERKELISALKKFTFVEE